jgi:hypothetical protein
MLQKTFNFPSSDSHTIEVTLLILSLFAGTVGAYSRLLAEGCNIKEEYKKKFKKLKFWR